MHNVGFAIFFMVAVLGAVLLLVSQVPLTRGSYDVVDTRSFSYGEPLKFNWTFEPNVRYRFEVKGVDWTNQSYTYSHLFSVAGDMYSYGPEGGLVENPPRATVTQTLGVTFFHYEYSSQVIIDRATTSTSIEISQFRETTYHLTYLSYLGLALLIISAILIMITGRNVDSRMRMPDTSARISTCYGSRNQNVPR